MNQALFEPERPPPWGLFLCRKPLSDSLRDSVSLVLSRLACPTDNYPRVSSLLPNRHERGWMGNSYVFWNQLPASDAKSNLTSNPFCSHPAALFLIVPLPRTAVYQRRLRTYARPPPITTTAPATATATTRTINQTGAPPSPLGSSVEGGGAVRRRLNPPPFLQADGGPAHPSARLSSGRDGAWSSWCAFITG